MKQEANRQPEEEIEKEQLGEVPHIAHPFDPSLIRMDTQTVNLGHVLGMLQHGEIELQPDFQRSADVWDTTQKSRLIESILLGLPLPSFYFNTADDNRWEVIDGLQRLSALKDFCIPSGQEGHTPLRLSGLEFLQQYEGKTFEELDRTDVRRIHAHKVTLNVIDKGTPKEVKYILFRRVNTAGVQLTPQELRHAINPGIPAAFLRELASCPAFGQATDHRIPSKRMEDRDFANRFLAFYLLGSLEGIEQQYKGELDSFLNSALEKIAKADDAYLLQIKADFEASMELAYRIFGDDAFRRRSQAEDRRRPITKALFDVLGVSFAWMSPSERGRLALQADAFREGLMAGFRSHEAFIRSIDTATGTKAAVEGRFRFIHHLIQHTLSL